MRRATQIDEPAHRGRPPGHDGPPSGPSPGARHRLRAGLAVLGAPNVLAGGWALVATRSWFDSFPGLGPDLVAAVPPYNDHLATDAGAGLFASGVVVLLAAAQLHRPTVLVALAAYLAFALPHAAYHVANPAPGLDGAGDVANDLLLLSSVALAVALLGWTWRRWQGDR